MTKMTARVARGKATNKQIDYALSLLERRGYSVKWIDSGFKALGLKMGQRSGSVRSWLESMTKGEISALIDRLK